MTAVFTLPKAVFEPPRRGYDGKPSRSRKVTYPLGEPVVTGATTEQFAVQVFVAHSAERKEFFASVNRIVFERSDGPFTVERFLPFSGVTLLRQPVARYSAKALEAFTAKVVELYERQIELEASGESHVHLLAMFDQDEGEWA